MLHSSQKPHIIQGATHKWVNFLTKEKNFYIDLIRMNLNFRLKN